MTSFYAFGTDPKKYFSTNTCRVQQPDGTWQVLSAPSDLYSGIISAANMNSTWIALSNVGIISYTTDITQSWVSYSLNNRNVFFRKVINNNGSFIGVGMQHNSQTLAETACIYLTTDGSVASSWQPQLSSSDPYSSFCDVAALNNNTIIAVGYHQSFGYPLVACSTDNGITWTSVTLPTTITGPIHSIACDPITENVWIGGTGWIATGKWAANNTSWTVNNTITTSSGNRAVSSLSTHTTVSGTSTVSRTVATVGNRVYYTSDNYDWGYTEVQGYILISSCYNPLYAQGSGSDSWWFGTHALLNQYDAWVGSGDPTTGSAWSLSPTKIGVHAGSLIMA